MSGITLYIAEKPSMARDIAQVLGAKKREGIKLIGHKVWVSWCIGHLVEIAQPDQHDPRWKSWRLNQLPVLPHSLKWLPKKRTQAHFKQLAKLIKSRQVTKIINACDAGREGELIFRAVYDTAGGTKPVYRFWVSSLTSEAIRKGLKQIRPSQEFDPLGAAAYCRAEADWLVGMNATRALTARATGLLSLGRVQTPTLNMIVSRQLEIDHFKPLTYWVLDVELESKSGEHWTARWTRQKAQIQTGQKEQETTPEHSIRDRLKTPRDADLIIEKIKGTVGKVIRAEGQKKKVSPPLLFHLTALQQECNKRFALTADRTLEIAQSLYENHKIISYPRTDSRYLTPDVAREIPKILQNLSSPWDVLTQQHPLNTSKLGRRYINAQKVTDHHAIIPTHRRYDPQRLNADEYKVYDLIVRSLLCALAPPALDRHTILETLIAGELFIAKGTVELEGGWRLLALTQKKSKDQFIPYVPIETPTRATHAQTIEKQTQAPKPYNDASLLGAMEHAGKKIEDESLRAIMKGSGLGTPATRANIIDTLLRRKYIVRKQKSFQPTETGKQLISAVNDPALLEPQLTAEWEQRLKDIAEGTANAPAFLEEIRIWVSQLVVKLPQGPHIILPKTGRDVHAKPRSQRSDRSSRTWSSDSQGKKKDSPSKSSKPSKPSKPSKSSKSSKSSEQYVEVVGKACPICQKGQMIRGHRAWGCQRWKEGCHFVIWFEIDNVLIPKEEAARLCLRKKTRLFHQVDGIKYRLEVSKAGQIKWVTGSQKKSKYGSQKKSTKQMNIQAKRKSQSTDKPWVKFRKS